MKKIYPQTLWVPKHMKCSFRGAVEGSIKAGMTKQPQRASNTETIKSGDRTSLHIKISWSFPPPVTNTKQAFFYHKLILFKIKNFRVMLQTTFLRFSIEPTF